jgi:hypothetical protein
VRSEGTTNGVTIGGCVGPSGLAGPIRVQEREDVDTAGRDPDRVLGPRLRTTSGQPELCHRMSAFAAGKFSAKGRLSG